MSALPAIVGSRLVERDGELAALVAAFAEPPALAIVEGEAGVGKSRLVGEALAMLGLHGRQVLIGGAHPVRDPFPLGPVLEALVGAKLPPVGELSPVVGALRPLLPERSADLPPALEAIEDTHAERHRVVRALVEVFHALGPAVLVLEDLHWGDERTVEVLGLLAARPPSGLSIAFSYRGNDLGQASPLRGLLAELHSPLVTRIALRPLSRRGVGELVGQLLGAGDISAGLARELTERTGGVPFIVEEDVRSLHERGLLVQRAGVWQRPVTERPNVPVAIAVAVAERAARLAEPAQAVIEATSVLGARADEDLVRAVCGLDQAAIISGLSEALGAGLLRESDGTIGFRHALGRDAIHEAIPGPRRRHLHLAAARAIEAAGDDSDLGQLAYHYAQSGRTRDWARCSEAAADLASSFGEDQTAYRYLRELLEAGAVAPERRAEVTLKLASAASYDPDEVEPTMALVDQALSRSELPTGVRGELLLWRGWQGLLQPETASAGFADLRAAVDDLHERPERQAQALATLGMPWAPDMTLAEHLEFLEAAQAAAERTTSAGARTHVAADTASLLIASGDPRAWDALEALPRAREASPSPLANRQLLRGLTNAATYACEIGHYKRARDIVAQGLRLADEVGHHKFLPWLRLSDLIARWAMGVLEGVDEELDAALHRAGGETAVLLLLHGERLLGQGATDEARAALASVVTGQLAQGELADAARGATGLVRIAVASGEDAAALAQARRVLDAIAATEIWVRAAPLLPFAPLDAVRDVIDAYRAGIAGRDAPLAAVALAFADARLHEHDGDHDTAAAGFADARRLAAAIPDPRLAAHAGEAEARARGAAGDPALLQDAWTTFTTLGAPWEANRLKHTMRQAGIRLPHRGGRRSYGEELSPREREVARLAAAGQTNRAIAETLFLSPRTVDTHLANALRKLNLTSRRELATALGDDTEQTT